MKIYKYNKKTNLITLIIILAIVGAVIGVIIVGDFKWDSELIKGVVVLIVVAVLLYFHHLTINFTLDVEGITKKMGDKTLKIKWDDVRYIREVKHKSIFKGNVVQIDSDKKRISITYNIEDYTTLLSQVVMYCGVLDSAQIDTKIYERLKDRPEIIRLIDEMWGPFGPPKFIDKKQVEERYENVANREVYKYSIWAKLGYLTTFLVLMGMFIASIVLDAIGLVGVIVFGLMIGGYAWVFSRQMKISFYIDSEGIIRDSGREKTRIAWGDIVSIKEKWNGIGRVIVIDGDFHKIEIDKSIKKYKVLLAQVIRRYEKEEDARIDPKVLKRIKKGVV